MAFVLRHGRVVDVRALGHRDGARSEALQRDTIFRIDALTRTVTAAAVLTLMEEGRFNLDDPVAAYLPEFRALRLANGNPPRGPLTIRQLLSQTAGFGVDAMEMARLNEAADTGDYVQRAWPRCRWPRSRVAAFMTTPSAPWWRAA